MVRADRRPHRWTPVALVALLATMGAKCDPLNDPRSEVQNTAFFPYSTVSDVAIGAGNGSGALVGPHMVLTCGHCVYHRVDDHYYWVDWTVSPGQYQDEDDGYAVVRPYGSQEALFAKTNDKYAAASYSDRHNYDYGALFLECPFTHTNGDYMPLQWDIDPEFVYMAGYPAEDTLDPNQTEQQYLSWGDVTNVANRVLYYEAVSTSGSSGSPVWEKTSAGERRIVGVNIAHSSGSPGIGTRLVSQNYDLINEWLDWSPDGWTLCPSSVLPTPWNQLLQTFPEEDLVSNEILKLLDPPAELPEGLLPTHRVVQIIRDTHYVWDEYEIPLTGGQSGSELGGQEGQEIWRFLRMIRPDPHLMPVQEAQVLLSASRRWQESSPDPTAMEVLPAPEGPRVGIEDPYSDDPPGGASEPDPSPDREQP